jgi:hypothetical protein
VGSKAHIMSSFFFGSFIHKVICPWISENYEYRKKCETHFKRELQKFKFEITSSLSGMEGILDEVSREYLELKQKLENMKNIFEKQKSNMDNVVGEFSCVLESSRKLLNPEFLGISNGPFCHRDNENDLEIIEYDLTSLKGLLLNRAYYSKGKMI